MKIVLTTLPEEGQIQDWTTPTYYKPSSMKYIPLGILSLATNLDSCHDVVILDPDSNNWTINETAEKINNENADVVGLSVVTRKVYAMNELLKKIEAPYKAVGGPHVTNYAELALSSGADAVFIGSLADLEFNDAVVKRPKGIIYCNTKINDIKFPDRSLLDIEQYFPKTSVLFKSSNRLPMFTSSGCPHRCIFCDVQNKKMSLKNSTAVVDEMEHLISLGSGSVHVLDDNFNIYERHVSAILDEREKRNITIEWSGRGQARMTESLARRLSGNNFKRIHVGIESLSDNILKYFKKSVNVSEIENFCFLMNKYEIDMVAYFIVGTPMDTKEYLKELPAKIEELGIEFPYFNMLFPSANTEYYRQLLKNGVYKVDYWDEFIKKPTPDFRIPYPYSDEQYEETNEYIATLIRRFEKK